MIRRTRAYTGNEISVNPVGSGGQTLLYPGGQYSRTVQPLLQPGQTAGDSGAINLHMPSQSARRTRPATVAASAEPAALAELFQVNA